MARFNNDDQVVTPAVELQAPAIIVGDIKSHIKNNQSVRLLTGAYLQFSKVSLVVIAKAVAFGLKGYRNKNHNPFTEASIQSKLQFIALGLEDGAPFSATEINCLMGQLREATDAANVYTANLYTEEERQGAQLLLWDLCRTLIPEIVYADELDETV